MNLADNCVSIALHYHWWQQPPVWFCTYCIVDPLMQRIAHFSLTAPSADEAMLLATERAKSYVFPTVETNDLNLEIDL